MNSSRYWLDRNGDTPCPALVITMNRICLLRHPLVITHEPHLFVEAPVHLPRFILTYQKAEFPNIVLKNREQRNGNTVHKKSTQQLATITLFCWCSNKRQRYSYQYGYLGDELSTENLCAVQYREIPIPVRFSMVFSMESRECQPGQSANPPK